MIDREDMASMIVEIVHKKPRTHTGPEAERLYAQLKNECAEIMAKGGSVDVPHGERRPRECVKLAFGRQAAGSSQPPFVT